MTIDESDFVDMQGHEDGEENLALSQFHSLVGFINPGGLSASNSDKASRLPSRY